MQDQSPAGDPATAAAPPLPPAPRPKRSPLPWRIGRIALRLGLLAGLVWLVWKELRRVNLQATAAEMADAEPLLVLLAMGSAVLAVVFMGMYDLVSFPTTRSLAGPGRWRLGTLMFAWANFLSIGPIGGPALRFYVYRRHGLETGQILRGLTGLYVGVLAGLAAWLAGSLMPFGEGPAAMAGRVLVVVVLSPCVAVLSRRVIIRVPRLGIAGSDRDYLKLGLVGILDWGAVLGAFVLSARAIGVSTPLENLVQTLFVGHVIGIASMMPGGLGSADAVWLKMLTAFGADANMAAAHILVFRAVFYVFPWAVSLVGVYLVLSRRSLPR